MEHLGHMARLPVSSLQAYIGKEWQTMYKMERL
jgi:hypothetical protein